MSENERVYPSDFRTKEEDPMRISNWLVRKKSANSKPFKLTLEWIQERRGESRGNQEKRMKRIAMELLQTRASLRPLIIKSTWWFLTSGDGEPLYGLNASGARETASDLQGTRKGRNGAGPREMASDRHGAREGREGGSERERQKFNLGQFF